MTKKLNLTDAIELYDEGHVTLDGVYAACETDLEFYKFLVEHLEIEDEDEIMERMRYVSGADDAYYNAIAQGM